MFKLLLKYMLGLTALAMIAVASLYLIAGKIHQQGAEQVMQAMHSGVFYSLQQQLARYPQIQWPAVVKQLRPKYGVEASIVPIAQLNISKNKLRSLLAGKFVVITGGDKYFFGYGVEDIFSYQRIDHSDYALQLQDIPIGVIAPYASAWMTRLITLELTQTPRSEWPQKTQQLQKFYAMPLSIIESVPDNIKSELKTNDFALSDPLQPSGLIEYLYVKIDNSGAILRIGPIPYPVYVQHRLFILLIVFIIITLGFVILLTYIFSRNLQKIYQITEQYSRADFSAPPPLNRHSTLRTLYDNILTMGDKIQSLMKSQRNLTRFVAHECRTPVSTMLFAIERLEQENLSLKAQDHVNSIKSDLAELNALVSDFLTYARFNDQELKLNPRTVDLNHWLAACIAKYKDAPKKVSLNADAPAGSTLEFDPELMKHVLYNLINNALKHARSQIQVTVKLPPSACLIQVDDDGIAIEDADKSSIFAPFVRLDSGDSGFGLGLHIAENIVKRHHGNLQVSDSPLGGTRFTVFLPVLKK